MSYTPPVYPGAIPTEGGATPDLPDRVDDIDWLEAARYNEVKKELIAVMTALGINPKGAAADVSARIAALEAAGGGVPAGLIAMWSGTLANIPAGWALCDGADGRPDLLDKFVKGVASAITDPGATGGESTVTLDIAAIPSHQHSIASDGDHAHTVPLGVSADDGPDIFGLGPVGTRSTSTAGAHTHGAVTGLIGGAGAHENKPPYYEVAFIIKT